jgi:hypothetical protein
MSKTTRSTPEALASEIACTYLGPDVDMFAVLEKVDGGGNSGKFVRLAALLVSHSDDAPSGEEADRINDAIRVTLPAPLVKDWNRVADRAMAEALAERDAAFLIGVEIGRRLAVIDGVTR